PGPRVVLHHGRGDVGDVDGRCYVVPAEVHATGESRRHSPDRGSFRVEVGRGRAIEASTVEVQASPDHAATEHHTTNRAKSVNEADRPPYLGLVQPYGPAVRVLDHRCGRVE